ncbi:hypothetical protein NKH77_53000 [Streptomyces sp. M19]
MLAGRTLRQVELDTTIPIRLLFEYPTVHALAPDRVRQAPPAIGSRTCATVRLGPGQPGGGHHGTVEDPIGAT